MIEANTINSDSIILLDRESFQAQYVIPDYFDGELAVQLEKSDLYKSEVYQWVDHVPIYSSSYNKGWEPQKICGPPKVYPRYGDITGAWAPKSSSGTSEYLVFKFPVPVFVSGIDIFETYCPGHIYRISALRGDGSWEIIWGPVEVKAEDTRLLHGKGRPRIFSPPTSITTFKTNTILLNLDCLKAPSWAEIDCAILRGITKIQWHPRDHHRYSLSFRNMVKTLLLINEQQGGFWLPKSIIFEIINFAAQDWPEGNELPDINTLRI
eukprot:TRINITY_DN4857_c0_g1_i1.p1 TRINITY_DN4857_c0_g1~~TRINITY_DN4857_c0_g1_i1.p1  ORF type:complete len:266 (-),score=7.22 TRINITY_DN4857_c0_g1_i1:47-844(-)